MEVGELSKKINIFVKNAKIIRIGGDIFYHQVVIKKHSLLTIMIPNQLIWKNSTELNCR
ncbi:MAG: hypothetical protein LBD34_02230 [Puniceicoccales bacterium]|jgi:hypothetical protein|nr:hypothetical protein [Puniceicoccales bacterium]